MQTSDCHEVGTDAGRRRSRKTMLSPTCGVHHTPTDNNWSTFLRAPLSSLSANIFPDAPRTEKSGDASASELMRTPDTSRHGYTQSKVDPGSHLMPPHGVTGPPCQAEEPLPTAADPSPPTAPMLRRASPDDREEEKQSSDAKRRRTCVEALESLETEKANSLDSFSFEARSIAPIETTPKFGSFNPVLSMETPILISTEESPPEKVCDESPAEAGSGVEAEAETEAEVEVEAEAEAEAEAKEQQSTSRGKNGNSQCSEAE